MQDVLFYIFATTTLACGVLVVANPFSRSPVTSAMFLVVALVSLTGLFVLLHAFFIAAVQVLVNAGAVMVLFLFVLMSLRVGEERRRKLRRVALGIGAASVGVIVVTFCVVLLGGVPAGEGAAMVEGSTAALGQILFREYLLPFEILSILLLVAMVGVILLSRKESE